MEFLTVLTLGQIKMGNTSNSQRERPWKRIKKWNCDTSIRFIIGILYVRKIYIFFFV